MCNYLLIATQINQYQSISINANHTQTYLIFLNPVMASSPNICGDSSTLPPSTDASIPSDYDGGIRGICR